MAINTSAVLRYIKRNIGASHFPLPIDDDDIMDIVLEESLYTFSKFFPFNTIITVNCKNRVPNREGQYFLDVDDLEIIGVNNRYNSDSDFFNEGFPTQYVYPSDGMTHQMITDLASYTEVPKTFSFIPPNIIEVFPKHMYSKCFAVSVKTVHPQHLTTIPLSLRDEFYKLCLLDVRITLWNMLKRMNNMATTYGTIDLKLDDFEQAESQRDELIERWRDNFIKEPERKKIWIG